MWFPDDSLIISTRRLNSLDWLIHSQPSLGLKHRVHTLSKSLQMHSVETCTTRQHYATSCSGGWAEECDKKKKKKQSERDRQIDRYRMRERQGASILPSTMTWQRGHNTAATWARGHSASPTPFHSLPRCLCHARILFLGLLINI